MADIYKFVKKSNNSRPLYTSYELSKNVKDKRIGEGISEAEFASKYGITMELLQRIEEGNSSFSPSYIEYVVRYWDCQRKNCCQK